MANPAARRGKVCSNSLLGKGLGTQNTASIRKVHLQGAFKCLILSSASPFFVQTVCSPYVLS